MAEYLRLERDRWVRLPGTNIEVRVASDACHGQRPGEAVYVPRGREPTALGVWDLTSVWQQIVVRAVGSPHAEPIAPPQRRCPRS
jgi:hypothetical protein